MDTFRGNFYQPDSEKSTYIIYGDHPALWVVALREFVVGDKAEADVRVVDIVAQGLGDGLVPAQLQWEGTGDHMCSENKR